MRIAITGCWRSGTTALYNLVRVICLEHGTVYSCFEDQFDDEEAKKHDYEIVKVHKFRPHWVEWSNCIFTIFREPDEVLESMTRFGRTGGRELDNSDALRGLAYWGLYQQYTNHLFYYDQLKRNPMKMARIMAKEIGVNVNDKEVVKKWNKIRPPKIGYDPITLLHSNHITK